MAKGRLAETCPRLQEDPREGPQPRGSPPVSAAGHRASECGPRLELKHSSSRHNFFLVRTEPCHHKLIPSGHLLDLQGPESRSGRPLNKQSQHTHTYTLYRLTSDLARSLHSMGQDGAQEERGPFLEGVGNGPGGLHGGSGLAGYWGRRAGAGQTPRAAAGR